MRVEAVAHQDWEIVKNCEPIFGVAMNSESRRIYRVRIGIDSKFFTSHQKYTTLDAANRAAKRIKRKLEAAQNA